MADLRLLICGWRYAQGVPYTNDSTVAPNPFGQQYPACNLEQPIPGLTVLDYAFLSDVAYIHNATQVNPNTIQFPASALVDLHLHVYQRCLSQTSCSA
jgi:hypothetical protein